MEIITQLRTNHDASEELFMTLGQKELQTCGLNLGDLTVHWAHSPENNTVTQEEDWNGITDEGNYMLNAIIQR